MEILVSPVFVKNSDSVADVVVNQGGTRSGKTYSILQLLIYKYGLGMALGVPIEKKKRKIDIVRKTRSELKESAYDDFLEILEHHGLYKKGFHNKSELNYILPYAEFRFIGMDQARKKKGAKRDILYINEADALTMEDWLQLSIRTKEKIFLDFNPSEEFFYHEAIEASPDYLKIDSKDYDQERDNPPVMNKNGNLHRKQTYEFIKSTYLDNYDFLGSKQILEIENLINIDDYYYKVYVLGELAALKGKIYSKWEKITARDYNNIHAETFYGIDFGFNNPSAVVQQKYFQEKLFEKELYYESGKDDEDLVRFLKQQMENGIISPHDPIYCDSAYPASIKKIRSAGFDARKAKKDVKDGIRFMQQMNTFIEDESTNHIKEIRRYKYKQLADGRIVEEPVPVDDHLMDARRYGGYTHLRKRINQLY